MRGASPDRDCTKKGVGGPTMHKELGTVRHLDQACEFKERIYSILFVAGNLYSGCLVR